MAITGVIGILNYQYYEQINLVQMDRVKVFFDNISTVLLLDELNSIKIWQSYKEFQESVFSVFYTYLVSLLVAPFVLDSRLMRKKINLSYL